MKAPVALPFPKTRPMLPYKKGTLHHDRSMLMALAFRCSTPPRRPLSRRSSSAPATPSEFGTEHAPRLGDCSFWGLRLLRTLAAPLEVGERFWRCLGIDVLLRSEPLTRRFMRPLP